MHRAVIDPHRPFVEPRHAMLHPFGVVTLRESARARPGFCCGQLTRGAYRNQKESASASSSPV